MSKGTFFEFISDYKYILGEIEGRALNVLLQVEEGGSFLQSEAEYLGDEMVEVAKHFARAQGIFRTGKLIQSIHREKAGAGRIKLVADVKDKYGKYYAGHQEYGFHPRGKKGTFVPARPFMRPALTTVAAKSTRDLTKHFISLWAGQSTYFGKPGGDVGVSLGPYGRTTQGNVFKNIDRVSFRKPTEGRSGRFQKSFSASRHGNSFSNTEYVRHTMGWKK